MQADRTRLAMRGRVYVNRNGQDSYHGYGKNMQNYDVSPYDVPLTSSTFWKSPYTGEGNMSAVLRTKSMIRPQLNCPSSASRFVELSPRHSVKSILKHRNDDDSETHSPREEIKSRTNLEHPPNLITTGTGKGRPHGSPVRSKTGSSPKRVQFSNKGQLVAHDRALLNGMSPSPYQGRRLYLDRATSNRILGDPYRNMARNKALNRPNNLGHITLNSAEATITSQIQSFIKKLRIAENDKVSMIDSELISRPQQKTAAKLKLKKSQSYSGSTLLQDWSEFDLDKLKSKSDIDEDQSVVQKPASENYVCNVYESKNRTISDTVSLESFSTVHDGSEFEQSPGGAKIFRPKANASLYTKYRHITTNDVNKYGIDYNETRDGDSKNFCDKRKTNQILGWLDGVRNAQSTEDTTNKNSS